MSFVSVGSRQLGHDNSSELWEEVVSLASYRRAVAASTKEIYYVDK